MSKYILYCQNDFIRVNREYEDIRYSSIFNRIEAYKDDCDFLAIKTAIDDIYSFASVAEVDNQILIKIFTKNEVIKLLLLI